MQSWVVFFAVSLNKHLTNGPLANKISCLITHELLFLLDEIQIGLNILISPWFGITYTTIIPSWGEIPIDGHQQPTRWHYHYTMIWDEMQLRGTSSGVYITFAQVMNTLFEDIIWIMYTECISWTERWYKLCDIWEHFIIHMPDITTKSMLVVILQYMIIKPNKQIKTLCVKTC